MKNNVSVRKLARCAVVAALYVVLCMALQPFSYGAVQVRVAEALCLLPVFGPEYIAGVVLGCSLKDGKATLRFSDNGRPYDPTEKPDPDTTQSAEEREVGGLGIFMVKKLMDEVTYEYADGSNILTLVKSL